MSSQTLLQPSGWSENELPPLSIPARVLRVDGVILRVITGDGPLSLRNARRLPIAVGDWLALDAGYRNNIRAILPPRDEAFEALVDSELVRVRAEVERLQLELDRVRGEVARLAEPAGVR
ncbi:hypothetical protein FB562_0219 [Homoserinimonas aerilata]|uniref:Uncharacterized protein n=1 Tax=Homoserinimonas aerilata TaxID=1162970 RepID=A0A542YGK0_9MICO|nr:hypothetical protein [Homoserinimonas aerilata]TQL47171.1 hypothetical protein FB562_0219 [Homoserinimonas aerilata]